MWLQIVELIFSFLFNKAVPSQQQTFKALGADLKPHLDDFAASLELKFGILTADNIKSVVDDLFAQIEAQVAKLGAFGTVLNLVLSQANSVVDNSALPALLDWLKQHGIVIS